MLDVAMLRLLAAAAGKIFSYLLWYLDDLVIFLSLFHVSGVCKVSDLPTRSCDSASTVHQATTSDDSCCLWWLILQRGPKSLKHDFSAAPKEAMPPGES